MNRTTSRFVGRDFARSGELASPIRRVLPMLLLGGLLAALALAALRVDLIRMRYALALELSEEKRLDEELRGLMARVGSLRDPARLGRIARERGFVRPERVIELAADPRP